MERTTEKKRLDVRWDSGPSQHFGLHCVEAFALADAQFDLHPVVGVVLEEEAIVDDELGVGPRAVKDVDLRGKDVSHVTITFLDGWR